MAAEYYAILGVAPDATQDEIKAAYRAKAKALHPDRYAGSSEPFQNVQEAYEVLCDAARRRAYDADLARARRSRSSPRYATPEPLVRDVAPTRSGWTPFGRTDRSLFDELFDELFGRANRSWFDETIPQAQGSSELRLEATLSPMQARRGGHLRVWLPVAVPCPACRGSGRSAFLGCPWCDSRGFEVRERPLDVEYPPGINDGDTGSLSLAGSDGREIRVLVRFQVTAW